MTSRGAAFPWPSCPHCQSANVAADGEYVCRECGAALGPVFMPPLLKEAPRPPPRYRLIMAALEREGRRSVRRRYSDVEMHLDKIAKALGAEVAVTALEMFKRLAGLPGEVAESYRGHAGVHSGGAAGHIRAQERCRRNPKSVQIHDKRHSVAPQAATARRDKQWCNTR